MQNKLECLSRVETRVTFRSHVLSNASLRTLSRSRRCHFDQSAMVRTSEYFSFFRANLKTSTAIRELSRTDGIMGGHSEEMFYFAKNWGQIFRKLKSGHL